MLRLLGTLQSCGGRRAGPPSESQCSGRTWVGHEPACLPAGRASQGMTEGLSGNIAKLRDGPRGTQYHWNLLAWTVGEEYSWCLASSMAPGPLWCHGSPGASLGLQWGPQFCKAHGQKLQSRLCEPSLGDLQIGHCSHKEALRALCGQKVRRMNGRRAVGVVTEIPGMSWLQAGLWVAGAAG